MNVLISGGGTGGHVYPALAVVEQLAPVATMPKRRAAHSSAMVEFAAGASRKEAGHSPEMRTEPVDSPYNLLWVGSRSGMEKALVERAGIAFQGVHTGQLRTRNPFKFVRNLLQMALGVWESLAIVRRFRPDVCFVTGGYVCGPVVAACWLRRTPVLIYLPDLRPGYAIRLLSRLAQRVAVSFPEAAHWFGGEAPIGKAVVTGYPVRRELVKAAEDRTAARRRLEAALGIRLDEPDGTQAPLLLIWGGSSGARAINRATWGALPELLALAQVVHVVGVRDWPLYEAWRAEHRLPEAVAHRYHPVAYLHEEMPLALAAADLSVARAGASTLGEFPVAKLPSILAPLHSVNQMDNAMALVRRGGAIVIEDEDLPAALAPTVALLLADPARLKAMEAVLAQMATPDAAAKLAAEIIQLAIDHDR